MSDANVVKLLQPGSFADPLTEVLRNGARALLAQAIEAEVAEFLAKHVDLKTATGLSRVVRHGHLPEREVMTGIGPVGVRQPRVRDRGAADDAGRIRFTPAILPPYARRSRSLEVLIPILYLKGISTGDFEEALAALLGKDAPGLSASTIGRLKEVWRDEHEHWRKRDLSAKRYVYVWADGIYLQVVEFHMRRRLAPILFDDHDRAAAAAERPSIVAPAERSPAAQRKVATRRTDDGLPVHSFRSLLSDLATLCLNKVSLPSNQKYRFELPTKPTPLQARAGELLGVSLAA